MTGIGLNCTVEGAVRLVGGETDAEGRVEYCYNGEWAPMCSLSGYTGSLICSEMGYTIPGTPVKQRHKSELIEIILWIGQILKCNS